MFDSTGLRELDAAATSALAAELFGGLVERETQLLQVAAHWADLHPAAALGPDAVGSVKSRRGREGARRLGGRGTPEVCEFAAAELGPLLQTTTGGAVNLMADALDLRHRLPRIWRRVRAGEVRSWQARKVAQATRHLTPAGAEEVDAAIAGFLGALPWGRFERLLEAQVMAADPLGAERKADLAEATRFVRGGRATEDGLKLLVAKATAGEVIWFLATVNRIADILALEGDPDTLDVRRSKAIGILAQPARATQLLWEHRRDVDSRDRDEPRPADLEEPSEVDRSEAEHTSLDLRPSPVNPARLRPPVTLFVHLSVEALRAGCGVARMEEVGSLTLAQVRRFFGADTKLTVRPVIDLQAAMAPADGYEVPAPMRQVLRLRTPADIFPYGASTSGRQDLDHTVPFLDPGHGGPPGQTRLENLGPGTRYHHRVKTHGRWRLRQPEPGSYLWRSPTGWVYLVNASGTHNVGRGPFAGMVWQAVRDLADPAGMAGSSVVEVGMGVLLHDEVLTAAAS